jgi:hypothetical protein
LIELREKEFDKKFRNDKELMVGDKPKTKWKRRIFELSF